MEKKRSKKPDIQNMLGNVKINKRKLKRERQQEKKRRSLSKGHAKLVPRNDK